MIRPLDLQTLYMNLDKVGKEQANSKEAQVQAQSHQVQKLAKEHDQGQHAVRKAAPTSGAEGEHSVKVDADGQGPGPEGRRPGERAPDQEAEAAPAKPEAFADPQLGKHVDLSG